MTLSSAASLRPQIDSFPSRLWEQPGHRRQSQLRELPPGTWPLPWPGLGDSQALLPPLLPNQTSLKEEVGNQEGG